MMPMIMRGSINFVLAICLLSTSMGLSIEPHSTVYFYTTADTMVLGNSYYELTLSKYHGGITSLMSKATNQIVTKNLFNCLWEIKFNPSPPDSKFSCEFDPNKADRFSYTWNPDSNKLALVYKGDQGISRYVDVLITITVYESNVLDMQMLLENHWGLSPIEVKFPSLFMFTRNDIQEVLLPVLPGLILNQGFFNSGLPLPYEHTYPGDMAADFVAIKSLKGNLALYAVSDGDRINPIRLGFYFKNCDPDPYVCLTHNYDVGIKDGMTWTSPIVRIRLDVDYFQSIQSFRIDNGIYMYESIANKLGPLYEQVAQSPLYKEDFKVKIFSTYIDDILSKVPYPGIFHLVDYWESVDFDENYPDFEIPDSGSGTKEEMVAMMEEARELGFLTMPYINPTWWDDESPTLMGLPSGLTINDLAVINSIGEPVSQDYSTHFGYVMSAYPGFVQNRLEQLLTRMKTEYPSDLIYEDQVGGRSSVFDYNPASPTPGDYSQGWFNHTQTHKSKLLTSEYGYDRLAETETGFHGSSLIKIEAGTASSDWGDGNWTMYPFAPILVRDKVLLYHNTEARASTKTKSILSMNLSFGYMLSFDINHLGTGHPWLPVVGAFQSRVLSKYAGEVINSYHYINDEIVQTEFETVTATRNLSQITPYSTNGYSVAAEGVAVTSNNGDLRAGVFNGVYNSSPLSPGDHYIIEERGNDSIRIYQPMGADTLLSLDLLPGWNEFTNLSAKGYDLDGGLIENLSAPSDAEQVNFEYKSTIGLKKVAYYEINESFIIHIPIVMNH